MLPGPGHRHAGSVTLGAGQGGYCIKVAPFVRLNAISYTQAFQNAVQLEPFWGVLTRF
jgi:hypothetical protein